MTQWYQKVKELTFRVIRPLHANQNSGFRAVQKGLLMLSGTRECSFTPEKQISDIYQSAIVLPVLVRNWFSLWSGVSHWFYLPKNLLKL